MANYPQELAQDAVCQSHTGHMTGLWFLPSLAFKAEYEWMNECDVIQFTYFSRAAGLFQILKLLFPNSKPFSFERSDLISPLCC